MRTGVAPPRCGLRRAAEFLRRGCFSPRARLW